MGSEQRYWYEHQLEQARARARVHGADTSKEQRYFQKLLEQEGSNMSEAALKVVDTAAPATAKPEPKVKTASGFPHTAKILLQTDQDGKQFGKDNNPKRLNSRAHGLFELYSNEMTVGDFIKAGGTASALKYDLEHGYIKVAV